MDGREYLVHRARVAGVRQPPVLNAIRSVDRASFVRPRERRRAYRDGPLPIGEEQTTSQPSLIAKMIEALEIDGASKVLEVGVGLGYQTALLAVIAREVIGVELHGSLATAAAANLARAGLSATIEVGDGSMGAPEHAPFDAIVVSAAAPEVPESLADQLVIGGRLVVPVGPGGHEQVWQLVRTPDGLERRLRVAPARFVRLVGEQGYAD